MEMKHVCGAGALMEVIDILRDDVDVEKLFEFMEYFVCTVGDDKAERFTAFVVELMDKPRIAAETFGACNIHHRIILP